MQTEEDRPDILGVTEGETQRSHYSRMHNTIDLTRLTKDKEKILEDERSSGWSNIFIWLAFARTTSFFMIMITFWIVIYQVSILSFAKL